MAKQDIASNTMIVKADSAAWGFIALIPFGWIFLWATINNRRSEAERGLRDKDSAIDSIINYAFGVIISALIVPVIMMATKSSTYVLIPNFVALIILTISAIRNILCIKKIGTVQEKESEIVENVVEQHEECLSRIKTLKEQLESLDEDDNNYDEKLSNLRDEITSLFNEHIDTSFPEGGKYKLYELMAEYYFVAKNKQQAIKYIKKAIEVRNQEKSREDDNDSEEENYDLF